MSHQGRATAAQHSYKLPAFASSAEAEHFYYGLRDERLAHLDEIATKHASLHLDYSPGSLKLLEQWYFQLYETDAFRAVGTDRETFEICMAMYFGETARRSADAHWVVEPYFLAPDKYELGVRKGSFTMMLMRFTDHFRAANNKKKQSLFRLYKRCFGRTLAGPVSP